MKCLFRALATICLGAVSIATQAATYEVAVLDVTMRVHQDQPEQNHALYSSEYMMDVAGLPYFTTTNLNEALESESMIVISEALNAQTFSDDEYAKLSEWVSQGRLLVAPALGANMTDKAKALFGIDGTTIESKKHKEITWKDAEEPEFEYFDTPEEKTFYIGSKKIQTTAYTLTTGEALATFDSTGGTAVVRNKVGDGYAFTFGVDWADVIHKAQMRELGSTRIKSNRFEPSSDIYPLFLRAAHVAYLPLTIWKHTMPNGYQSVLIFTHDQDSTTGIDFMHNTSEFEKSRGIIGQYFITTHYFPFPGFSKAWYIDEKLPKIQALLDDGHTLGSHSVSHFADFNDVSKFPMTVTTREKYAEECKMELDNGAFVSSVNGSTWAEVVMSKQILDEDFGIDAEAFRPGHLALNANVPEALELGGYKYTSSFMHNQIMGQFPRHIRMGYDGNQPLSSILEIPLNYSDSKVLDKDEDTGEVEGLDADNWEKALPFWIDCYNALINNYAPNVILIHANKDFKLSLEETFLDTVLPEANNVGYCNLNAYGRFWNQRHDFDYKQEYDKGANTLTITVDAKALESNQGLGLVVETNGIEMPIVRLRDTNGEIYQGQLKRMDGKTVVVIGPKLKLDITASTIPGAVKRCSSVSFDSNLKPATFYYTTDGSTPTTQSRTAKDKLSVVINDNTSVRFFVVAEIELEGQTISLMSDEQKYDYTLHWPVGDANGDTKVTSVDLFWSADYIVGNKHTGFVFECADVNLDSQVSIGDVTSTVDIILDASPAAAAPRRLPADSRIDVGQLDLSLNGGTALLSVVGESRCIGMQFDLEWQQGCSLVDIALAPQALGHSIAYRQLADNKIRAIVYSLSANILSDAVVTLTFDAQPADLRLTNAMLDYRDANGVPQTVAATSADDVSGIDTVQETKLTVYAEGRTICIVADKAAIITIATLDGRSRVMSVNPGINAFDVQQPGLYLVAGSKIMIK